MRTYIAGAGAMGCLFGYKIFKSGQDVILLDNWDTHIKMIQYDGLSVTGDVDESINIPIMKPTEVKEKADFIILFTKAMQLPEMLENLKNVISDETKVLCLLNGIGHEEVISKYVKRQNILMGVTVWTSSLNGPGSFRLQDSGAINLQCIDASGEQAAKPIVEVLNKAGLNATYDDDVIPSIWRKACVNGTMNATCALEDCKIGEFFDSKYGKEIAIMIVDEFTKVAVALGIEISERKFLKYVMDTYKNHYKHYPSMHQDLIQNRRLTEVDYINGAAVRLGYKVGISCPYNECITNLIHAKEDILGIR